MEFSLAKDKTYAKFHFEFCCIIHETNPLKFIDYQLTGWWPKGFQHQIYIWKIGKEYHFTGCNKKMDPCPGKFAPFITIFPAVCKILTITVYSHLIENNIHLTFSIIIYKICGKNSLKWGKFFWRGVHLCYTLQQILFVHHL